jgi:hypothetical protein
MRSRVLGIVGAGVSGGMVFANYSTGLIVFRGGIDSTYEHVVIPAAVCNFLSGSEFARYTEAGGF